jgi:serine/threonine protein kinase
MPNLRASGLPPFPDTIPTNDCKNIQHFEETRNSALYFVTHQRAKRVLKACVRSEEYGQEVTALKSLSHIPGVIRCHADFVHNSIPCLVLDYCMGGDLLRFYQDLRKNNQTLTAYQIQIIARTLLEPLALMHENGFVHCDIKLENFLMRNQSDVSSVILADFGLARQFHEGQLLQGSPGTIAYQAPELFTGQGFSTPVDIWAFGMSLFILFTGREYFFEPGRLASFPENVFRRTFIKDLNEAEAPADAIRAIMRMLTYDPSLRPTAAGLHEMSYFKHVSLPLRASTKETILHPGVGDEDTVT